MKRVLLLASAIALFAAAPGVAQSANLRGAVVAKDAKRHTVVIAATDGSVSTLRAGKRAGKAMLGRIVAARVAKLPDGTYSAGALRSLGKTRHARISAVVVKRLGARLLVSAGHSVFTVRLKTATRATATDGELSPGDEVDVDADIHGGELSADEHAVTETGHTDKLELEGIYLSTTGNVLDVAIVHRGLVHVQVPDGVTIPAVSPGDEVALVVTVGADNAFSLVSLEDEDAADSGDDSADNGDGVDIDSDHAEFTVVGILASLTPDAVSVKVEGHPEPVVCAIKHETPLEGHSFPAAPPKVGDRVEMHCKFLDGHFVLAGIRSKEAPSPDDGTGKFYVTGTLTAFDSSQVAVRVEGRTEPITCSLPPASDMLGFAVGELVQLACVKDGDRWVVAGLRSDHAVLIPSEGKAWFGVAGTILFVDSARISVQVEHHPSPVTCAVPAGADLSGFAVGDKVQMACVFVNGGFKLHELKSDHASFISAS
jgi:hypothetical protein